jgi:hypothetical protein
MGVVLPRPRMDVVESVKRCVDNPSVSCCSRRLYGTIVLLWYLIYAKNWLTTRELCSNARFRNCNEARVYLYRLKKRGIVETSKIHTNETIWRINEEALKKMDPRAFLRLLTLHYNMCTEYYKTGNLKKPVEEDIEEEEFEEEAWEDIDGE